MTGSDLRLANHLASYIDMGAIVTGFRAADVLLHQPDDLNHLAVVYLVTRGDFQPLVVGRTADTTQHELLGHLCRQCVAV